MDRSFWAIRFCFIFPYFFSFLSRALDYSDHLVSFWAHAYLPYRIVSYRIAKLETSNLVDRLVVASQRMTNHPMKGAWSGHVEHLNFGEHQPYASYRISGTAETRVVKFCSRVDYSLRVINHPLKDVVKVIWPIFNFAAHKATIIYPERLKPESPNFVCR